MDAGGIDINSLPAKGSSPDRKPREKRKEQAVIREHVNGFVLMHYTQAVRGWSKVPLVQGLGKCDVLSWS